LLLPQIADASQALASRFIILTMKQSFYGREDTKLTDKLLTELPGILNWSLKGLARLYTRGVFKMPESSLEAVRTLEDLSSPVGAFVRDYCVTGSNKRENVKIMYAAWKTWCEAKGEKAGSEIMFGKNLRAVLPAVDAHGHAKKRYYQGVELNEEGRKRYEMAVGK
jgi:putative DNA primase/helicase